MLTRDAAKSAGVKHFGQAFSLSWPGLTRPSTSFCWAESEVVDAHNKCGQTMSVSSLRGAKATKQSRVVLIEYWIASLALAMTIESRVGKATCPAKLARAKGEACPRRMVARTGAVHINHAAMRRSWCATRRLRTSTTTGLRGANARKEGSCADCCSARRWARKE